MITHFIFVYVKKETTFKKTLEQDVQEVVDFHAGTVNKIGHAVGIAGMLYSFHIGNIWLFVVFMIVEESGHFYNHFRGIHSYDTSAKVLVPRILFATGLVVGFYSLRLT